MYLLSESLQRVDGRETLTLLNVTTPAYKQTLEELDSTKPTDKTHIQVLRYLLTLMSCRLMIPYDDPKPLERHMFL